MKRTFLLLWLCALFCFASHTHADWSQDVRYDMNQTHFPRAISVDRGAVVADVRPDWPGKEVLAVSIVNVGGQSLQRVRIVANDNSQTATLSIPQLYAPDPWGDFPLWIQGLPAVGDVDEDGDLDVVLGYSTVVVAAQELSYSAVAWWTWNGTGFDEHYYYDNLEDSLDAFQSPTVCHTEWTNGDATVAFFGRYKRQADGLYRHKLVSLDLRYPGNVRVAKFPTNTGDTEEFDIRREEYYVASGDVDGDGYDELVFNEEAKVSCLDWNLPSHPNEWAQRDGFPLDVSGFEPDSELTTGGIALADVDADGHLDILLGVMAEPFFDLRLIQIPTTGTIEIVHSYGDNEGMPSGWVDLHVTPSMANLSMTPEYQDQNGRLNPIFSTNHDLRMYRPVGVLLNTFPYANFATPDCVATGTADVMGRGYPQVIHGGRDVASEQSKYVFYDPITGDEEVQLIDQSIVPFGSPDTLVRHRDVPAVSDIDWDGLAELVVLPAYRPNEEDPDWQMQVIIERDLNVPFNPELASWSQFQNGPEHRGLYSQPVTGTQPLAQTKWTGRVTVRGTYTVPAGYELDIEPGSVIEFHAGANLVVNGNLNAAGSEFDSIYFRPDGTSDWGTISVPAGGTAWLQRCVIHGGGLFAGEGSLTITGSHIYDAVVGIDAYKASNLYAGGNDIHDCDYGVRGSLSRGGFDGNTIHHCQRAGVYWVGDHVSGVPPIFGTNTIRDNGVGVGAIAGCYFSSTTAYLTCNVIENNNWNQVKCEEYGNIVMNQNGLQTAGNYVADHASILWCGLCPDPEPLGYKPLVSLYKSWPGMAYGHNTFHFDQNGTFFFDRSELCAPRQIHQMKANHYEPNSPPGPGNEHFCPTTRYYDPVPDLTGTPCGQGTGTLDGAFAAFASAAQTEADSNYAGASNQYRAILEDYPETEEAIWSARGFMRTSLAANGYALPCHDSLRAIWLDESRPWETRASTRREAIWALVADAAYGEARFELEPIVLAQGDPDSLWAVVTLELVTLLEQGGMGTMSVGDEQPMQVRVNQFHDRLHQLMGRQTDAEILSANSTVPRHVQLCEAYPNPFNATVTLKFEVPEAGHVELSVFNTLGQRVATLIDETRTAGSYQVQWDGSSAASGVYLYQLRAGTYTESRKMVLMK